MTNPYPSTSCKATKRIFACAAAVSSCLPQTIDAYPAQHHYSAAPTTTTTTTSTTAGVHESLWGTPATTYEEDPEPLHNYIDTTTSTAGYSYNNHLFMRGGTDEAIPKGNEQQQEEEEVVPKKHKKKKKRHYKPERSSSTSTGKEKHNSSNKPKSAASSRAKYEDEKETINEPSSTTSTTSGSSNNTSTHPHNPMVEEILQHEDYYDILGLPRGDDDASRIKKAYRRLAARIHPDKTGGDRRAFDNLAEAYDVLSDDNKRALYDRYGKDGLDPTRSPQFHGSGMGSTAEDLFRSFFGAQSRTATARNRTVRYQLEVTLEELYKGKTRKVTVEAPQSHSQFFYHGPSANKKVEVSIPRGAQPGQSIVLSGAMDFDGDDAGPPGDLIFQLHVRPHKTFTRRGHDLAINLTISFQEAICGCRRSIRHLDGRNIVVESAKRFIPPPDSSTDDSLSEATEAGAPLPSAASNIYIQTGDVQVLKGQGMPKNPQGTEFGDLYVQYSVELPKSDSSTDALTTSERMELARLLEKMEGISSKRKQKHAATPASTSHTLEPASLADFGRASGTPPPPNMDDHEHHDDDYSHHFPFGHGTGQRQFFFSSSSGGSPFFGQQENFDDDPHVQCSQM